MLARILARRGAMGAAVLLAVLLLFGGSASAQPAFFTQAVQAVNGTVFVGIASNTFGNLTDGSAYNVPLGSNVVSFTGGQFTTATNFTVTSSTQIAPNVVTFSGIHSTSAGAAAFSCTINLATGAGNGNCQGFLGLGGPADEQTAIAASTQGIMRDEARATANMIGERLREIGRDIARGLGGQRGAGSLSTGLAAGDGAPRFGVWIDASGSYLKNDAIGKAYQGWTTTDLAGLDVIVDNRWVLGFSAGYNHADVTLNSLGGSRLSRGAVAGPYVSYIINEHFAVDANVTFAHLYNDFTIGDAPALKNHVASNRWAGGINANYFTDLGPLALTCFTGYTLAYEHQQTFTDPTGTPYPSLSSRFGAVKLGGELSYPIGDAEPYLPITYEYQTSAPQDGTGRNSLIVGVGFRYRIGDALKAGIVATDEELRSHERNATIAANLRYSF